MGKKAVHAGFARGLKVCGRAYGGRQGSVILLWQGAGSNGWAAPVAFRLQALAVASARGTFRQTPAVRYDAGLVWTPCSYGAAAYRARVPFIHFFDGFRTSHEVQRIARVGDEVIRAVIDEEDVAAFRARAMSPEAPTIRGTAQNPDVYFQGREAVNRYHAAVPGHVQAVMDRFAAATGRHYRLFEYHGHPQAERVIIDGKSYNLYPDRES